MDNEEPSWDLYRTFLAVVHEGSLSAAARRIGLAQPTAGRHVEVLEALIGTSLFTRSQRGLISTPAARQLVPHAEAMAAAASALRRVSSSAALGEDGTVRVTAGVHVGHEVLPSLLAAFARSHPRIVLELSISDHFEDMLSGEADIAVRMARPTQQALIARRIGEVEVGAYAHRRYADAFGLPTRLDELAGHRLIGFDRNPFPMRSAGGLAAEMRREQFGFRCDSAATQIAAMRAGLGIAGCQVNIARCEPELVRVLEQTFRFHREIWLAMHRDAKATPRVRLLFDHLVKGLTAYVKGEDWR